MIKTLILLDQELSNKEEVVNFTIQELIDNNLLKENGQNYKNRIYRREDEVSTDMGKDIAIPHAKSAEVIQPFLVFLRLKSSVIWDEEKNTEVKLVFMIGVPEKNEENNNIHLEILSSLARKLMHDSFTEQIMYENNVDILENLLKDGGK